MGASARSKENEFDKPSPTEQLSHWINRVRCKKLMCRRNRKRDLRVEAVLTSALYKAEYELRSKQLSRVSKWQQYKRQFLKEIDYSTWDFYKAIESGQYSTHCQMNNPWEEPLCPELSSLDDFMSQLAEIKIPLER